jgi:hypothetical protein
MLHGDLSNEVEPRMLWVWEGLLATLQPANRRKFDRYASRNPEKAVAVMDANERAIKEVNDLVWRRGYAVDVITFLSPDFVKPVEDWLASQFVTTGRVMYEPDLSLARRIAYTPDIVGVFHALPDKALTFGSKGYLLDPFNPNLYGAR